MRTKLVYVALDDYRLQLLLEASIATGIPIEVLIQQAVTEFIERERKRP